MSTPALVKKIAPEFSGADDSAIQDFLDLADNLISEGVFRSRTGLAKAYLAAHLLKVAAMHGQGQLLSEDNGQIKRTYANLQSAEGGLEQTTYGRMFLSIQKRSLTTPVIV